MSDDDEVQLEEEEVMSADELREDPSFTIDETF